MNIEDLDNLMNLAGELVLTRNQLLRQVPESRDSTLATAMQHLDLITTEMQEKVMQMRMQPVSVVWGKFPRVVRDVSRNCGKDVRLDMEGAETELDKTLLEAIKDPLTHIVRNSIDHGIEAPEERKARGKPTQGVLLLRAFHSGGQVTIECIDDGGGVNAQRIREKALEKGVLTPEQAADWDDQAVVDLIFHPGLSTAEKVTNVSGRGVGMDVVRSNIEKVGGSVEIDSRPGEGTTVKINLPLTLAIVPALIVRSGEAEYAIPQSEVVELVRLERNEADHLIEHIQETRLYRLRGELLPLLELHAILHPDRAPEAEDPEATLYLVVMEAEGRSFGLLVDKILETQEIVVKPLSPQLSQVPIYAGATILGDGSIAMILDPPGIAKRGGVRTEQVESALAKTQAETEETEAACESLVLVGTQDNGRAAIHADYVGRLEKFPRSRIELVGGQEVIQHNGQIMPLVYLDRVLPERREKPRSRGNGAEPNGHIRVVVLNVESEYIGLVVERILDIVSQRIEVCGRKTRKGVAGTVVIQDRVTELLDVGEIVATLEV